MIHAYSPCKHVSLTREQVNCSFYYKIGACRHGDRCSRKHVKPSYSQTVLLPNLYQNPAFDPKNKMDARGMQNHFDAFYEDIWCEMCKYGEIEEVVVCDNNNDRKSLVHYTTNTTTATCSRSRLTAVLPC